MTCSRCKSTNIQVVNENHVKTKHRGCFGWLMWLMLALFTFGLILIIPLITNSKTKSSNRTKAACMDCGYKWYL